MNKNNKILLVVLVLIAVALVFNGGMPATGHQTLSLGAEVAADDAASECGFLPSLFNYGCGDITFEDVATLDFGPAATLDYGYVNGDVEPVPTTITIPSNEDTSICDSLVRTCVDSLGPTWLASNFWGIPDDILPSSLYVTCYKRLRWTPSSTMPGTIEEWVENEHAKATLALLNDRRNCNDGCPCLNKASCSAIGEFVRNGDASEYPPNPDSPGDVMTEYRLFVGYARCLV